ncbi:MAG: hypothetical protein B7Z80_07510 [Rhodospirillales bacterium 20-64-7]|nr:MAG: hypothetical protein B7Z80_07510 [Rhodospirillales bacterium 20-64-7]HQT76370.1 hypothetical protein [Rhodopila sp.]
MKSFLLAAAATLTLGVGVAAAQGAPQSMVNPPLGAPWTAQKLAAERATHQIPMAADQTAPKAERSAQSTTLNARGS